MPITGPASTFLHAQASHAFIKQEQGSPGPVMDGVPNPILYYRTKIIIEYVQG